LEHRKNCTKERIFNHTKYSLFTLYLLKDHPLKTGIYSVLFSIISNIAIGLCFVPFLLLGWKKIRQVSTFWILGVYWLLSGLVNLPMLQRPGGYHGLISILSRLYMMAETPLVLLVFASASPRSLKRQLWLVVLLYFLGESSLIGWKGYGRLSSELILGVGLLLILLYSVVGLVLYLKRVEHTRFENSMVFIYAAELFAYGSGLIIYIFAHYHSLGSASDSDNDTDSFLLYYISLLLSALVTCTGLWIYGIRKAGKMEFIPAGGYSSSSS
jgi:hypothetical protein